jgi:hypothetical protein
MASTAIDRLDGLSSSAAIKGPARVATTANITLYGLQTIDGVSLAQDDRVLVKDQTDASENGVYVVDTGQWRRSTDFNKTRDVVKGTIVYVTNGTVNATTLWIVSSENPVVVGTDNITFSDGIVLPEAQEMTVVSRSAGFTADNDDNDSFQLCTAAITIAIDPIASLDDDWHMWVSAQGGAVIIDPNGSETIDGSATLTIPNGYSALIVSTGVAFFSDKMSTTIPAAIAAAVAAGISTKADILNPFTDIASATMTTIAGVASESVRITGTTTITSLGTATAGTVRLVKFAAALTLTNNANIIIPTGANITTTADDVMFAISEGTTIWRILWYRGALATSDWTTGTKTTPGMPTPAQIAAAIAALGSAATPFVSAQQTITAGGALTIAHGLGARPTIFQLELVCATAENGYSIADIVPIMGVDWGDTSRGLVITADATNIFVRYGATATTFALPNKTTGTGTALTNANWRLVIRAKLS